MTKEEYLELRSKLVADTLPNYEKMVEGLMEMFFKTAIHTLDEVVKLVHSTYERDGLNAYARQTIGQLADAIEAMKADLKPPREV